MRTDSRQGGSTLMITSHTNISSFPPGSSSYVSQLSVVCCYPSTPNKLERFYSWRRYCNKHQIRLGGYSMDTGDSGTPPAEGDRGTSPTPAPKGGTTGPGVIAAAQQKLQQDGNQPRNRSPTPPRALYRSTTGKGVAFTDDDVAFLVRFMEYRK